MKRWFSGLMILAVIALTFIAFGWLAYVSSRGGETAPLYSIRRYDPYGAAGLAKLLEHRGQEVVSLQRPRLDSAHQGTLIQLLTVSIAEDGRGPAAYRLPTDQLLDWVARGNTLIQFSRVTTREMRKLEIELREEDADTLFSFEEVEAAESRGLFPDQMEGRHQIVSASWKGKGSPGERIVFLRSPGYLRATPEATWQGLAYSGEDAVACELAHGEGKVVFVTSPSMALNQYLGEHDNLEAVLSLIDPHRPVIFDEWAHGVGHAGSIMDVIIRFGLVPLMVQIALAVMVFRWTTAGLPSQPAEEVRRRRSSREQIHTLGHLYDQAWDMPERIRRVHDELVHRFATACRSDPSQVLKRLQSHPKPAGQAAARLLEQLRALAAAHRPTCTHCGYDLTQSAGDHCPECGKLFSREVRRLMHRDDLQATPARSQRVTHRELARILTESHQLSRELSVG